MSNGGFEKERLGQVCSAFDGRTGFQCQLATCPVDVEPATTSGSDLAVVVTADFFAKAFDGIFICGSKRGSLKWVKWQEIDMAMAFTGKCSQR